jgi:mycothiol system anti-sigma-R factor
VSSEQCAEALKELYVFLDGELTTERRTMIRSHLDHCTHCLEAFDFEAELRAVISTRCSGDVVPDRLRAAVAEVLAQVEKESPGP